MPASVATLVFAGLILGLLWLDRDHRVRASVALWTPNILLSPSAGRSVSEWLMAASRQHHRVQVSAALWLPVIWLFLAGSRSVSEWLLSARPGTAEALVEGDPINRAVYTGLVALGLVVLAFRGSKVAKLLQANGVIVVFLLYCAVSLTWADYPEVGFKRWVKVVGDFVMVLIVVSERHPTIAIRRLLARTGFLLIPLSVLMIKYYPDLARYYDRWDWSTYYSGAATNKNALGVICLIFGLASAWQFLAALSGRQVIGRARRVIAHGVMLTMAVWLFKHAHSMTALACFLVGIGVLVMLQFQAIARQPWLVHALVISAIVFPSSVLFLGLGPGLLSMIGKDPTLTDRTLVWDLLLSLHTNPLHGMGFENFWLGPRLDAMWRAYRWGPTQAHNGYLEVFLNLGWIGVALLTLILITGYQTVMTGLRRSTPTSRLMLAYFVVGIVFNFTEAAFFRISSPVWFIFLLTITKAPDLQRDQAQAPLRRYTSERIAPVSLGAVTRAAGTRSRFSSNA